MMVGFWAGLPPGSVRNLVGASPEAIAIALEPLPTSAPAVLTCHPNPAGRLAARVVDSLLDQLEAAALDLFPAWLPGAGAVDGPGGAGVPAVRALAAAKAAQTPHLGPFLAGLAVRAVGGRPAATHIPAEVRATGLARVIADSFGRAGTALLLPVPEDFPPAAGQALLAAGEWLAHRGGFAVWLTGPGVPPTDRVPRVRVRLPEHVATLPGAGAAEMTGAGAAELTGAAAAGTSGAAAEPELVSLRVPATPGRPATGSKAEHALEAALAAAPWAAGRVWNRTLQTDPLAVAVRIDLLWPAERVAVEIDGAEHRGRLHYELDRRRDVQLQLAGFAVLRFTNEQTLTDTGAVLWQLERFITVRRDLRRSGEDGHAG